MIDIHSHIIPGVDDGAKDWQIALKLLEMADANGISDIIATPHVLSESERPSWPQILSAVEVLRDMAVAANLKINIHPGAELELNWDMLTILSEQHGEYCLAHSRYVLLELPAQSIPAYAEDFFYQLQLMGKIPVLAHPERHSSLRERPEILFKWLDKGVLTQTNIGSLNGLFGSQVQSFAQELLTSGAIHFLASDAHNTGGRNTDMARALAKIEPKLATAQCQAFLVQNPENILNNKFFVPPKAIIPKKKMEKKPGFWSRLLG